MVSLPLKMVSISLCNSSVFGKYLVFDKRQVLRSPCLLELYWIYNLSISIWLDNNPQNADSIPFFNVIIGICVTHSLYAAWHACEYVCVSVHET